jgi:hypothetical protein
VSGRFFYIATKTRFLRDLQAGVIIGDDLVVRYGEVVCQHEARASQDRSVFGWKKIMRGNPAETRQLLDMVIKNTYRTLMTPGMKGCYVYSTDEETQWFFGAQVQAYTSSLAYQQEAYSTHTRLCGQSMPGEIV